MKRLWLLALLVAGLVWGCTTGPSGPPPISVTVAPGTATVQAGGTTQVTATVTNDSASKGVNWSVSCSVASCGSVSPTSTASGAPTTYTAPANAPASDLTVTVTATSVTDNTKKNSATITVPAITVTVAPATATVLAGATVSITATVANDPGAKTVTWSVTCAVASCGSVSPTSTASGTATTYTAPGPPASNLTVTVTATSVTDNTKKNSATITVPAITVAVAPSSVTVLVGTTQPFTATVTNDAASKGVTWSVTCAVAPCGSVSPTSTASGSPTTYTPPAPPASNITVTLKATAVADGTKTNSATITIPSVTVSVAPTTASVPASGFTTFTATVGNDGANKGVTWLLTQGGTPCSPTCGTITPSSASGAPINYTAPATVPNPATVTVTATSVTDTTKSASATVTIVPISVSVSPSTASVVVTGTQQFTATVSNDVKNLGVSWTITQGGTPCPSGCGTVSPSSSLSGVAVTYTAPASVPTNPVTLTATSVSDPTKSASAAITVIAITVSVSPTSASVGAGGTLSNFFMATTNDPKGVNWTTSCGTPPCGTVSPTSSLSGASVSYTAPTTAQTVTLTATSVTDNTKSASATITVTAITVSVSPTSASVGTGSTLSNFFMATTNDPKGVNWTTSCGTPPCGTVSPTSSLSGASVSYTAPATAQTVTLKATSVTDGTTVGTATITVISAAITVSISPSKGFNLHVNGVAAFGAIVVGDTTSSGVNWAANCTPKPGDTCGTFSDTTTVSTFYTAPANPPNGNTVTITATSKADNSKTASVTLTIKPLGSNTSKMSGRFVFLFHGFKPVSALSGTVFTSAGTFVADGTAGLLSGIQEDRNDAVANQQANDTNGCAGDYSVEADNRGDLLLFFCGPGLAEVTLHVFRLALTDDTGGTEGRIIRFDDTDGTGIHGSGFFVKQTPPAGGFVAGTFNTGYAFGFSGAFTGGPGRVAVAGVLQFNGAGGISSTGSAVDSDASGVLTTNAGASGSYTVTTDPTLGTRGTITLTTTILSTSGSGTFHFAFYPVSVEEIVAVSTDGDTGISPAWSGRMFRQSGSFTNSSLNAAAAGYGAALKAGTTPDVQIIQIVPNGSGSFTGTLVDNRGGTVASSPLSGTYSVASNGRTTITVSVGKAPVLYVVSANEAFGVGTDGGATTLFFTPQTATSLLVGAYFGFGTALPTEFQLDNISGTIPALGTGTISGMQDDSSASSPFLSPNQTVTGTSTPTDASGVGTVTLTSPSAVTAQFIVVSNKKFFLITTTTGDTTPKLFVFGR